MINGIGIYILPELIDIHTHFRNPGYTYKEDFYIGSPAVAAGEITTIVDMSNYKLPVIKADTFLEKVEIAKKKSFNNFVLLGFVTQNNFDQIVGMGLVIQKKRHNQPASQISMDNILRNQKLPLLKVTLVLPAQQKSL